MKIVIFENFVVSGSSIRTNNASEATGAGKISGLWAKFYSSHPNSCEPIYGVYSDYESDASGKFTVTAGVKTSGMTDPDVTIQSGEYMVFDASGAMPMAIIDAWKTVWAYFSQEQKYERVFETDFEEYSGQETATLYIGVKSIT